MEITLEEYKELSASDRGKVKKKDLMFLLNESIERDPVSEKLDTILNELAAMRGEKEKISNEIKRIDGTVGEHSKILSAHQKFMEDLDSEKRARHMIVLGLKEDQNTSDDDKLKDVVNVIGVDVNEVKIENIVRLGKADTSQPNKTRPLKVTFEKRTMRDKVLKNSNKLKEQDEESVYRKIFLKKDTHPEVRKEEKRLYEVFKAEKNKAENVDKEVIFDRKTRVVTVNDEEVDRFKLFSSFQ